jgi:hypothetical protein
MHLHLKVMLADVLNRNGERDLARQQLNNIGKEPLSEVKPQPQLFAQYLKLSLEQYSAQTRSQATPLLNAFINIGDYHSYLLLTCWLADQDSPDTTIDSYIESVRGLLDKRFVLAPPK